MINDLVTKTIEEMNEKSVANVEREVKALVSSIVSAEAEIVSLQADIKGYKEKLKALQMPATITLEL